MEKGGEISLVIASVSLSAPTSVLDGALRTYDIPLDCEVFSFPEIFDAVEPPQ